MGGCLKGFGLSMGCDLHVLEWGLGLGVGFGSSVSEVGFEHMFMFNGSLILNGVNNVS